MESGKSTGGILIMFYFDILGRLKRLERVEKDLINNIVKDFCLIEKLQKDVCELNNFKKEVQGLNQRVVALEKLLAMQDTLSNTTQARIFQDLQSVFDKRFNQFAKQLIAVPKKKATKTTKKKVTKRKTK